MTAATLADLTVPRELLDDVRTNASALDQGEAEARRSFPALGAHGLLDVGAPGNDGATLPRMAAIIAELSAECMSSAFAVWANRMTVEYLLAAGTEYGVRWAEQLRSGTALGVTGMASAFQELAGCGTLDISATADDDGYRLDGTLRWASNLYDDSLLVTAARTDEGQRIIVAVPLDTPGIAAGNTFSLLALGSTASSYLKIDGVRIGDEQVLTTDFTDFMQSVRPTFLVLQTALCVGLARTSLIEARNGLRGVNEIFTAQVDDLDRLLADVESTLTRCAATVGGQVPPTREELLSMRLAAAELATGAATIEVKSAGGRGYANGTPANRRFREAAFIPVQSPSEAQLRWELAHGD